MIKFRFLCVRKVDFGQAIYISGNIPQLGSWKPQNALQLKCYQSQNWFLDVQIPLQTDIEYKFFVSKYIQIEGSEKPTQISQWIGNFKNQNLKLSITKEQGKLLDHQRKTKQLRVMSFNVRAENSQDPAEYSWKMRKQNCLKLIRQQLPSILGFQEATINQKCFLNQNLQTLYNCVDCGSIQGCQKEIGILYNRQRFLVVEGGQRQIGNKGKTRTLEFAILQDTYTSSRFLQAFESKSSKKISELPRQLFFVGNLYLDFHSTDLQKTGLSLMNQLIKQKSSEYKEELRDIFILGDFNLPQNSHLLHSFEKGDVKIESIRKNFLRRHMKDVCDLGYTFQAFENDLQDVENPNKTIDHLYISGRDYEPAKFQVIRTLTHKPKHAKKQIFSDHYPIMGVFKHKKEQTQVIY